MCQKEKIEKTNRVIMVDIGRSIVEVNSKENRADRIDGLIE